MPIDWSAVDTACHNGAEASFAFLEALVLEPSTLGNEHGAVAVLSSALTDLGFDVDLVGIDDSGALPGSGIALIPADGRSSVAGTRAGSRSEDERRPSLLLNGHLDVVSVEDTGWSTDPFRPVRKDGWLYGRGAGDMKCGFAAGLLALTALDATAPGWQAGHLTVIGAIEEECTGLGTASTIAAGHLADAVLLLEPTELEMLLGGVGIVWVDIEVDGSPGHAFQAEERSNPAFAVPALLDAVRALEELVGRDVDDAVAGLERPYRVNVGRLDAGRWHSSVPTSLRCGLRIGHGSAWSADDVVELARSTVTRHLSAHGWPQHGIRITPTGFRADPHAVAATDPLVLAVQEAHRQAHGTPCPTTMLGSTTDARFYVRAGVPAVAYGPRVQNMHGADEGVDLASIVETACTLTRFLVGQLGEHR